MLAGCVSDQPAAVGETVGMDKGCSSLVEHRNKLARQIDAVETGRASASSTGGALRLAGMLGGNPANVYAIGDLAHKLDAEALHKMMVDRQALEEEIDARQCTAEARAGAGSIKQSDSAELNGVYAGKGRTDSWCPPPFVTLRLEAGKLSGRLTDGAKGSAAAASYRVRGRVFDDGEVSLSFKARQARTYTDEIDGRLKNGVLSFAARLDPTAKACTYRFAVRRKRKA
jgi:hypothetical protein